MTYNASSEETFEDKLIQLFNIDDTIYGLYATYEDPISGKIDDTNREEIIQTSLKVGRDLADKVLEESPNKSVADRIEAHNIELVIEEDKENTKFVYFGTYEHKGPITLFKGNISKSERLLKKEEIDWLSVDKVSDIVLAHELFHFYEDEYPDLYTNTKEINLWKLGPYQHKSKLICPSEIAAMSFTKQLLNLDFNPGAINYLLYSSIDKKTGEAFYEKITDLNKQVL